MKLPLEKEKHLENYNLISRIQKGTTQQILKSLKEKDFHITQLEICESDFQKYLETVDYPERFPHYFREFSPPRQPDHIFNTKCLEHFLSFELCKISNNKTAKVLDVAASNSPVKKVLETLGYTNIWKQDIQFTTDLSERIIGGDAKHIDADDNSFDTLLLHNSWEHFEGESPSMFIKEASRILKPNGTFCIIPLFCDITAFSLTSPSIWETKYRNVTDYPEFSKDIPVFVDEGPKQRLIRVVDASTLISDIEKSDNLDTSIYHFTNADVYKFSPFALLCRKRSPEEEFKATEN